MKNFLLILFLLCCFGAQAQEKDDFKRFGVGVNYAFVNCYSYESEHFFPIKFRDAEDSTTFNFSTGIMFHFNFNKHFSLQTGVQYATFNYQTKMHYFKYYNDTGIAHTLDIEKKINFPIRFNYIFGKQNLQYIIGIEATPFLLEYYAYLTKIFFKNSEPIELSWDYEGGFSSRFGIFTPSLNAGIDYNYKDNFHFRLEAYYQFHHFWDGGFWWPFTPTQYYWSLGFNFSLIYSFN